MSVSVSVNVGAPIRDPPSELELQVAVSCLTWVLGTFRDPCTYSWKPGVNFVGPMHLLT